MNKLLYFGTGRHFQPTLDFLSVKEFVFVDSQPYTEFFEYGYTYDKEFYRKNFVQDIKEKAIVYDFEIVEEQVMDTSFFWSTLNPIQKACYLLFPKLIPQYANPTMLKFINSHTSQTIKYYISNPFPYSKYDELIADIKSSDGLIISGYHPDKSVLDYIENKKIKFIGYHNTFYGKEAPENLDLTESNNLIQNLHSKSDETIATHFNEFILVMDVIQEYMSTNNIYDMDWQIREQKENEFIKTKPVSKTIYSNTFNDFLDSKKLRYL